jgi:hypothetical protein
MADAIDNLAIDLNQANTVDEFPGYPGYKMGDLVPNMGGVRIGDTDFYGTDAYGQKAPYNWRTGRFEYAAPPTPPADTDSQFESYLAGIKDLQAPVSRPASSSNQPYNPTFTPMAAPPAVRVSPPANFGPVTASGYAQPPVDPMSYYSNPSTPSLSNPSTLGGGSEIDYNIPDDPTIRINEGSTDEKDAFVRTGIGTTLDPKTEDTYGVQGLVPPDQAGGTVGVQYLDPSQVAATTAGQIPSVPQGVVTRGETVKIPGRGLPDYEIIGRMDDGSVIYADPKNTRDSFVVPGVQDYPGVVDLSNLPEVVSNVGKGSFRNRNRELSTPMVPFQETATPVESYEPTAASVGGFDNTGGSVSVGPGVAGPSVDDTIRFNPDYKPKPEVKPGDEFKDSPWQIFEPVKINPDYINPVTGKEFPPDQDGNRWNFTKGDWDYADPTKGIPPVKDTPKPPVVTTPPGGGTTTTPPGGGTTTTPPGGGARPGTGTYTGTPLPTREPVTPLVRRETVIPTKGTKEVPLPDRQADPFAKLYADLLANSQQQQDQYRYINYDPDQIMNAAMSGFRRRGAMRSLQGY